MRSRRSTLGRQERIAGYLLIAPNAIGLLVFYLFPILFVIVLSLFDWSGVGRAHFAGLGNLLETVRFGSPDNFIGALRNTFFFVAVSVPSTAVLAITLALLITSGIRASGFYRVLYFLPVLTMPVAITVVWKWLFNGDYGLVNSLLNLVAIKSLRWATDPDLVLWAIIIVDVWIKTGYATMIMVAGLRNIPTVYLEAASIDGANPMQKLFRITLPLLSPVIFFVAVILTLFNVQVFDQVFIFVESAAGSLLREASRTAVYSIYEEAFIDFTLGRAAAQSVILLLIVIVLTWVQFWIQRKWVYYE